MSARTVLYGLLSVVAAAAAVLSFAALRDLALVCGFSERLAWLLPVVVDAGAAAGSLVWLGGHVGRGARSFARALALALLGLSVAANALGHGLAAFALAPPWWVVVIVSAIAPAVLGAVVHLAVLVGRPDDPPVLLVEDEAALIEPLDDPAVGFYGESGLSRFWDHAQPAQLAQPAQPGRVERDRAADLIADGAGRRRLARELGVSEYEARRLLDRTRTSHDPTSATSDVSTSEEQGADPQRVRAINGAAISGAHTDEAGGATS